MSDRRKDQIPLELLGIAGRLETERPRATEGELDRIKLMAITGASRGAGSRPGKGRLMKSRRVASVAVAAVLVGSGGAVFAQTNSPPSSASSSSSSANSQYCPPSSQQPGNPKDPGPSKCGKPKTK